MSSTYVMHKRLREAPFALRIVRRIEGEVGLVYRRSLDAKRQEDRLKRVATISPLAWTAGTSLARDAVRAVAGKEAQLTPGPFHALDADWGARVACYGLLCSGLRDPERLHVAAQHFRRADANEAAWWLGLLSSTNNVRSLRALRILVGAVD